MRHIPLEGRCDGVIGLQDGDEAKGRLSDDLAAWYDWVVRYNGGANAGHTIEFNGRKLALHQIPSGVAHPRVRLYLASECLVNLEKLDAEIGEVESPVLPVRSRLLISSQASVIQPSHILRDTISMKGKIGTTGNGIGPCAADKHARTENGRQLDIRLGMLVEDPAAALEMVRRNYLAECDRWSVPASDVDQKMGEFARALEQLRNCVDPDPLMLQKQLRQKARVLLEGAQSIGLHVTYGTTPYVTASRPDIMSGLASAGIPPEFHNKTFGVAKLTPSKVGNGPFVSEYGGAESEAYCMAEGGTLHNREWERQEYGGRIGELLRGNRMEMGIAIRILGGEYGATTKRPRRMGALDLMKIKQNAQLNGVHYLFLSKLDQLAHFAVTRDREIPVVTGYRLDGRDIDYVPTTEAALRRTEAVETRFPGFSGDISGVREQEKLPLNALATLHGIRDFVGAEILSVGVGPDREQVVHLDGKF